MDQPTFNGIVETRCRAIRVILASKAKEYARGDRLHNFKRAAIFMRKEPTTVCWFFAMKHITSVMDLVDDIEAGAQPSMAMADEKLGDAINYLVLLEALIIERAHRWDHKRYFSGKVKLTARLPEKGGRK